MRLRYLWLLALLLSSAPAWAKKVDLDYHVQLLPQTGLALVSLTLADGAVVRSLDFDLGTLGNYSEFKGEGQWQLKDNGRRPVAAGGGQVQPDLQGAVGSPAQGRHVRQSNHPELGAVSW